MAHTILFMWFGGPISATSIESIKKWAEFLEKAQEKTREQLKIADWIDSEGSTEQAIHATKARLAQIHNVEIELRDISELREAHPEMHRIMRYEIDKLNANYSAASDVGRYTILEREAGMYLDTDVHPPEEVDSFIRAWKKTGVLITESASQGSIISNSDLLIAPQAHLPVLERIVQYIPKNYRTHYVEPPDGEGPLRLMCEYQYFPAADILFQTYLARDQEIIYSPYARSVSTSHVF
ncbi:MAG: glycosyltransferase [Legionellales bacterium]|nr:glycosyltransferase [Legionellales bacterium]